MKSILLIFLIIVTPFLQGNAQDMVYVQGGTFKMGSNNGFPDEKPAHKVTVNSYWIGKYEVTVAEYRKFVNSVDSIKMPAKPPWGWHDNHPIINITWQQAEAYCKWLSKKTGKKYRLPTEAEWEYAARGGNKSKGYKYSGSNNPNEVCWYDETTNETGTRQVGTKKPNELGMYDMSGNVWEWCTDVYDKTYYKSSPAKNPNGPAVPKGKAAGEEYRVIRGGSWYYDVRYSTITARDGPKSGYMNKNYGFRLARSM